MFKSSRGEENNKNILNVAHLSWHFIHAYLSSFCEGINPWCAQWWPSACSWTLYRTARHTVHPIQNHIPWKFFILSSFLLFSHLKDVKVHQVLCFSIQVCKTGGDESGNRSGSPLPDSSFMSSLNRGPTGYNSLSTLTMTGSPPSASH